MENSFLSLDLFDRLFPFFVLVDHEGRVRRTGRSLAKVLPALGKTSRFENFFEFQRPHGIQFGDGLKSLEGEMVILNIPHLDSQLMGQLIYLADENSYLFVVSLMVQDASDMSRLELDFNDFAIQDQIFDFMMLLQTQRRSINEADALNKKLAQSHKVAVEASQMKSQFLANMSHELRTPMNGVLGMASVLLETPLAEDQLDYVQTIITSGEGMLSLVNDILDLSKIEAGHLQMEDEEFTTRDLISEVVQTLQVAADRKGLTLAVAIDEQIPERVFMDRNRLRQVLLNLLGNAVKFTAKGRVELEIRVSPNNPDQIAFRIRDSGIGMNEETLRQIFQPFVQGDSSMTKRFGGTGLGLSICKKIVEAMGGKIGVQSEINKGSEFWFTVQDTKKAAA